MGDMNFSLTTFNKTGKLLQIEYALNRVQQGKMALGIKATNGVVIATDKKVSSVLVDEKEYEKIQVFHLLSVLFLCAKRTKMYFR